MRKQYEKSEKDLLQLQQKQWNILEPHSGIPSFFSMASYINKTFQHAMDATLKRPYSTAFVAAGVLVAAVPALAVAPVLGSLGFGALGPVAGSAAAGIQSGIGNVAAGSLFATLQSAGMGGAGIAVVNAAVSGAAGAGSALRAFHWWATSEDGANNADEADEADDVDGTDGAENGKEDSRDEV
ncbi:hypothetical protein E4U50_007983 [Claviceps purpurea]|nr:hypothetical protein E4U50_007983 [Claviceps purpurea]